MNRQKQKNYCVQGIIISKKNFFEADKIIHILTREKGIIDCIVKGARKPKSKLSGVTELFIFGEFYLAKGKKTDILTASKPKEYFREVTSDLEKMSHFFLISETLDKLLPHEIPNEKIFRETIEFFKIVNIDSKPTLVYECIYKILIMLGYGLSLENCVKCHKEIELSENNYLSLSIGGILCNKCRSNDGFTFKISLQTIKLLRYIEKNNIDKYSMLIFDEKTAEDMAKIINTYLGVIYQKEMKSPKFVRSIKELQKSSKGSKI